MKLLPKRTDRLQYEFLPSALEIVETPPSPFGRIVIWLILALLGIAFVWAYLGEIDVIASGQGKIMPAGNVKTIQPANGGVINSIRVSEGEKVKKDQLLIELDSTLATTELQAIQKSLTIARLERDILKKTLAGEDPTELINSSDLSDDIKEDLRQLVKSQNSATAVQRQFLSISISNAQSQLNIERKNLATTENNLKAAQTRKQQLEQEIPQSSGVQRALLESELQHVNSQIKEAEGLLLSQQQRIAQAEAGVGEASGSLSKFEAEHSSSTIATVVEQDKHITELEDKLAAATKNMELMSIKSPVDGTVLSIASNTIGGVVTTAQPLVIIVPDDTPLIIEATLQPKDVGFVREGQKVAVKVDTYSFQRFGYLHGTVKSISADTFDDEKHGPIYKIKITIDDDKSSKGNIIKVNPGMTVTSEITTEKRRIIDFFLDPFITHTDDSLKVR